VEAGESVRVRVRIRVEEWSQPSHIYTCTSFALPLLHFTSPLSRMHGVHATQQSSRISSGKKREKLEERGYARVVAK